MKRKIYLNGQPWPLIVSPDAQLKYLKPGKQAFDTDLIKIAENLVKVDSVVWDIGANVGVFSFAAASVASQGTIVSVEADIWLAGLLRKTSRLKAYEGRDIRIVPVAISDQDSVASFRIAARGRASNSLDSVSSRSTQGGVREVQYVPTLKLDSMISAFPAPDFVKIDVEGAESLVVAGAKKLMNKIRPVFYIEIGADSEAIVESFQTAGYVPDSEFKKGSLNNIFFVPDEKSDILNLIESFRD